MMSWLPEDVSTFGREVDSLFYLIYYITGTVFILVMLTMIAFLVIYRQRQGRRAVYSHGNNTLEIIWTIVPAVIFVGLSFMSQATWAKIKSHAPPGDVELQVTGKQFNWEVVYPGPDGKFGTPDDLMAENELHVPVGKIVRVYLRSKDVIHSFYLPNFRLRQDAVPGREILVWFEATKPGKYELPCSQLCGFGHSGMKGWLYVHTAEEYAKWVKEKWPVS
ncbi:MAG TPA: cytochrome c oxidase subunit II [Candidatus Methylomirabilis sp.]|nr:cytochrome c oxidase subunit II [Candidatus Methylomirabilis sp.]